jgi:hypothetical protein
MWLRVYKGKGMPPLQVIPWSPLKGYQARLKPFGVTRPEKRRTADALMIFTQLIISRMSQIGLGIIKPTG